VSLIRRGLLGILSARMVKDYFQDIVPPHESNDDADDVGLVKLRETGQPRNQTPMSQTGGDRSIRNINISRRSAYGAPPPPPRGGSGSKHWVWILAFICVAALAVLGFLFAFGETSITVVPHSQKVLFDESSQFTAYPESGAAAGTLTYTIKTSDFEDSESVAANGTEHKEQKASGTITVVNDYSAESVKLLKSTRFATAGGLIFRTPVEVTVPGKQGSTPGKVTITVAADQAGDKYNIGAGEQLTLPGLQSNAAMYRGVYAQTSAPFNGGFVGDAPATAPSALSAAKATMQARLDKKVADYLATLNSDSEIPLRPIVSYADMPAGPVDNGSVSVRMSAHVSVPVVQRNALAAAIAQAVTADSSGQLYTLETAEGFAANTSGSTDTDANLITFTLSGNGILVAIVDTDALAQALAGRDQNAFQNIVANFPGVESAKARIEPFWSSSFPKDLTDIKIVVERPQNEG